MEPWEVDLKDTEMKLDKMMAGYVLSYGSEFWRVRESNKKNSNRLNEFSEVNNIFGIKTDV
jgi:hypothetical protein